MTVRFRCKTGKNLRVMANGDVNGMGGDGQWATFTVHVLGPGRYGFCNKNNYWLAIKGGRPCSSMAYGDPDAGFLLHLNYDNSVSFESQTHPGRYIGVKRKGGHAKTAIGGKPSTKFYTQVV